MKKLSESDRQFLLAVEKLRSQDMTWPEIAVELQKAQTTVYDKYHRLKLRALQADIKEKGAGLAIN